MQSSISEVRGSVTINVDEGVVSNVGWSGVSSKSFSTLDKVADTEPKSSGSLHFVAKIKIVAACRMGA